MKTPRTLLISLLSATLVYGCSNSGPNFKAKSSTVKTTDAAKAEDAGLSSPKKLVIKSITNSPIGAGAYSSTAEVDTSIYDLAQYCVKCTYKLNWTSSTGSADTHTVSAQDSVRSGEITFVIPATVIDRMTSGGRQLSSVNVTFLVQPDKSNPTQFSADAFSRLFVDVIGTYSFLDSNSVPFTNLRQYPVAELFFRGRTILNSYHSLGGYAGGGGTTVESYQRTDKPFLLATYFTTAFWKGTELRRHDFNNGRTDVLVNTPKDPIYQSAQSYFRNLYSKEFTTPALNPGGLFVVPKKQDAEEPITYQSTFALAQRKVSGSFDVPVETFSTINPSPGGSSKHTFCDGTSTSAGNDPLLRTCQGFASKPQSNGTCGKIHIKFEGSNTLTEVPTYRLRRYVSLNPTPFDSTGRLIQDRAVSFDELLVLDRPVFKGGKRVNTIPGPKPCPIAWMDEAVSGVDLTGFYSGPAAAPSPTPGSIQKRQYAGTYNPIWSANVKSATAQHKRFERGLNVDGTMFPWGDLPYGTLDSSNHTKGASCSALFPIPESMDYIANYGSDPSFGFGTADPRTPRADLGTGAHVRPGSSWAPLYEEDTDFLACAPESQFIDMSKRKLASIQMITGVAPAYCAEIYPSGFTRIEKVDGVDTSITYSTYHSNDTVRPEIVGGIGARGFRSPSSLPLARPPLQAPAKDVAKTLLDFSRSYGCHYNSDEDGAKYGAPVVGGKCCVEGGSSSGNTTVWTASCTPIVEP